MNTTYALGGLGPSPWGDALRMMHPDGRENGPNQNLHICFPNGVTLSLVWGWGAYCDAGTVEVGVLDASGLITEEVALRAFGESLGDSVDGWCDADRVHAYFIAAQGWTP